MPTHRTIRKSFSGGELSPEFLRPDDAKYQSGLALCRNFIPKPHGPIENRAGTQFVRETSVSSRKSRLIPFTYSTTQTMVIGIEDGRLRFYTQGAVVMAPAANAWSNSSATVTVSTAATGSASITIGSPCVVTLAAHGLALNAPVAFTTTGTLPTGITAGVTYYVTNPDANTFNLATEENGAPIDTSGTQSGVQTLHKLTAGVVTWNAHGRADGDAVSLTTSGSLPANLSPGVYYIVNAAANTFEVSTSLGGKPVMTYGSQSGTHTAQTAYRTGHLVTQGGTKYYAIAQSVNQAPPNASYWYALPGSGEYEVKNGYAEADIMDIHYVQSADVLTFVHPNYPPMELRRISSSIWTLTPIVFATQQVAPSNVSAVASGGTGTAYKYVVTAVDAQGLDESVQSLPATCSGNLFASGAYNTITWKASQTATRYRVYKLSGGLYGYIGQCDSATSFKDDNIAPDPSRTPPLAQSVLSSAGDYPGAVSYFEQRRVFAATLNKPQSIWMSKSGTESNMNYSLPIKDDDSIQFRVAAREANTIRHIVPLSSLLLLTSAAEWRVTSVNSDAITPSTISVSPQSYIGASNVQPAIIGNNVLYCAARGGHVREMAYAWQNNGYISGDLSLRSSHLFDTFQLLDMAYAKAPYPILWIVSSTGKLLSFTYVPEQQIGAWAQHDTDGAFESCCVVAEGEEDALYVVVKRTINGTTKRYVERLHSRLFAELKDAFFVDCGLTYSGAPSATITGLGHLEGKQVAILGDGGVMPAQTVTAGAITLQHAVSTAHVGLPITADAKTLPVTMDDTDAGQGRNKNTNMVSMRVHRTSGLSAGPSFGRLTAIKQRSTEPYGSPPSLRSEEIDLVVIPGWGTDGVLCVRQSDPLPATILNMTLDVAIA